MIQTVYQNSATRKLQFYYLPDYIDFIRRQQMDEYVQTTIALSRLSNIPLLKYLDLHFGEAELTNFVRQTSDEFLKLLAENKASEQIAATVESWKANNLPIVGQYQITSEDLTLVSFIRRKTLTNLLPLYTTDFMKAMLILNELEDYFKEADQAFSGTYIELLESKLKTNEDQLLQAQSLAGIGSFILDLETFEAEATPEVYHIIGLEPGLKLVGFLSHLSRQERDKFEDAMKQASMTDGVMDVEYKYAIDDKVKLLWTRGSVYYEEGRKMMKGTVMDLTERYSMLQQLRDNEILFKQAQERAQIGNFVWNLKNNEIFWSDELYHIYGLDPQGEKITYKRYSELLNAKEREYLLAQIEKTVASGTQADFDLQITQENGTQKVLNIKAEVQRDKKGSPDRFIGTVQDVTEKQLMIEKLRKNEDELQQKNMELALSNQNLQEFAYVASHDMKEPLRKISTFGQMLLQFADEGLNEKGKFFAQKMIEGSFRMQQMVDDLLSFAVISNNKAFERVSLNQIVDKVLTDLELKIRDKNATIEVGDLPDAKVVSAQFEQLFLNLISNSLKFSKEDVPPLITIHSSYPNKDEIKALGLLPRTKYLKITVTDNGIGFEPEYANKIFGMFQRLHGKVDYEGSGIGLSVCKKIVENHGGIIKATGHLNVGATFEIIIPA
ncbi:MAG TPA: ATP-binding protein [Flavipsychrobacter sp.]|nr:ATP-binding protein [Flavipsychrobacter sp.]